MIAFTILLLSAFCRMFASIMGRWTHHWEIRETRNVAKKGSPITSAVQPNLEQYGRVVSKKRMLRQQLLALERASVTCPVVRYCAARRAPMLIAAVPASAYRNDMSGSSGLCVFAQVRESWIRLDLVPILPPPSFSSRKYSQFHWNPGASQILMLCYWKKVLKKKSFSKYIVAIATRHLIEKESARISSPSTIMARLTAFLGGALCCETLARRSYEPIFSITLAMHDAT